MNGTIILTLVAMTAMWPFGRGDKKVETTGTIKDLESQVVEVDPNDTIDGSEAKAMESYRSFLDLASDDPLLQAEATRRLADLQLETEEAAELQSNVESLGANMGGTIELYEQLLSTYPNYTKNDLVLYQLSRAYEAAGDTESALLTLDKLVNEYPNTPHFDEAHFRRGETLFVEQRYREAEQAYEKVLGSDPNSNFSMQSRYKLGWSLFKQQLYEESATPFFDLLDGEFDGGSEASDPALIYTAMGRAQQELIEDSFRVLSISFSYMNGADSITEYFETHGDRNYAYIVYTNLGDLYLEQERYQDAAGAYEAFVAMDAYHAKAPLMQIEVMEAFKQGGFAELVLEAKQGFVERYGPGSPYWNNFSYEQQPEVVAHLKSNLTDLAAYHHAKAQADKDPAEYAAAARWYRSYLQSFPEDVDAPQTNFLLSEVLYESGAYRDAALEYERTAYAYPYHERSAEAGYAALLAYAEQEKLLAEPSRAAWHLQGIQSALRFATTYDTHEQAAAVQTNAAEKLFALNDFARARDVGRDVVARVPQPDPALQRTAWTVIAHSEFDLADFAAAETAYVSLNALIPAGDEQRAEIVERIASSIYKQGEQARASGDSYAAVDHFLRVGRAAPTSPIRATAEYDAAAALIQLGDWPRATAVLEDFRAQFPDHELAADVSASLAVAYVEAGDTALAAGEFERIADGDGSEDVRKEALWRAAELYRDSGQNAASAAAFGRYVDRHPRPVAAAIEARQHLADLAQQSSDRGARMQWLAAIVEADAAAGQERSDRTRYLAAKAQLVLAEPARNAFHATRLVIPLADSLSIKRQRMEAALEAYGKAADYGVAEVTTAATFELADLYHGLSRDLFASERPAELSAAELEQYDLLLEEQAYPFEEEAIELHEVNAARTVDGLYDEWVAKSLTALATLVPVRYAKPEIGEQFVSAIQ
jgi:TolA-binding protein